MLPPSSTNPPSKIGLESDAPRVIFSMASRVKLLPLLLAKPIILPGISIAPPLIISILPPSFAPVATISAAKMLPLSVVRAIAPPSPEIEAVLRLPVEIAPNPVSISIEPAISAAWENRSPVVISRLAVLREIAPPLPAPELAVTSPMEIVPSPATREIAPPVAPSASLTATKFWVVTSP